jgi:ADP-ribose pyrophosphatase
MDIIRPWPIHSSEPVADMRIFQVRRDHTISPRNGARRDVAVVDTLDWVNIIALTAEREVVCVRQYRHGTRQITLEIPGGIVQHGEDPGAAGARELGEETGYAGEGLTRLGVVEPNPAFLTNRCHTYLVTGARRVGDQQLDEGEDIEVVLLPLAQVPAAIADGRITHALVVCAFWWLASRRVVAGWP